MEALELRNSKDKLNTFKKVMELDKLNVIQIDDFYY